MSQNRRGWSLDFERYLRQCTDAQVRGVFEKEEAAGRLTEAWAALLEARSRGIELHFNWQTGDKP